MARAGRIDIPGWEAREGEEREGGSRAGRERRGRGIRRSRASKEGRRGSDMGWHTIARRVEAGKVGEAPTC